MILSDNETKIDLLNNGVIAQAVVELIKETPDKPLSVGIHGDWGAGKSSILEMIEEKLTYENKILSIKFNGWQFQGFEDAKIALIEGIVTELIDKKDLKVKAGETVKMIMKNIDWLKVAKNSASVALSLTTGVPPISMIKDGINIVKDAIGDKDKGLTAIDKLGSMINGYSTSDISTVTEITEFRQSFDNLIEEAKIDQLVVLIDDLDRCLPKTTIETLEAIRLLMFTKKTAFVIAADESMIEYSVKEHFPTTSGYVLSNELSKRYLEKLIQVPFRIPSLGRLEAKTYILLLLIISECDENDIEVSNLIEASLDTIKKPWVNHYIKAEEIKEILGDDKFDAIVDKLEIAQQISNMLTDKTKGNPRKIKRFLNTLMLRYNIAELRGFTDDIKLNCLAKIMLIEQFEGDIYNEIALTLDNTNGQCEILNHFEEYITSQQDSDNTDEEKLGEWRKSDVMNEWAKVDPKLGEVDLRPYYFINQDGKSSLYAIADNPLLLELFRNMSKGQMQVAKDQAKINELSSDEADVLYEMIIEEITTKNEYKDEPVYIYGLKSLIAKREQLQEEFISFISTIRADECGPWIVSGWESCLTSSKARSGHKEYLKILSNNGTKMVKVIANQALKGEV